jgi:hypothetical protein
VISEEGWKIIRFSCGLSFSSVEKYLISNILSANDTG